MLRRVAGIFNTPIQMEQALSDLHSAGVPPEAIRVVTGDPGAAYAVTPETGAEVPIGSVGGTGAGGAVGAATGWLADTWALALLEVEFVAIEVAVAAGPLAGLAGVLGPLPAFGAGVGAAAGGLLGIHAGWAVVEKAAREYRTRAARGEVVVLVQVSDGTSARHASRILRRQGAHQVRSGLADD